MWEWLIATAKDSGPFGILSVALLGAVAVLWRQHVANIKTITTISNKSSESSSQVAIAVEKSAKVTALAIQELSLRLQNGGVAQPRRRGGK